MKQHIVVTVIFSALTLLAGCATPHPVSSRGPAYGHEELFRRQLADSKPVTKWGYTVEDVRFSDEYRRAVVVFGAPGRTPVRREAALVCDEKGGYTGRIINFDIPHSNPLKIGEATAMTAEINVNVQAR